jgi:hypothetical protein
MKNRKMNFIYILLFTLANFITMPSALALTECSEEFNTALLEDAIIKVAKQGVKITSLSVDKKRSKALISGEDNNHTIFMYSYDFKNNTLVGLDSPPISVVDTEKINLSVQKMKALIRKAQSGGRQLISAQMNGGDCTYTVVSENGIETFKMYLYEK